jgi:hypothetical protein
MRRGFCRRSGYPGKSPLRGMAGEVGTGYDVSRDPGATALNRIKQHIENNSLMASGRLG